MSIPNIPGMTDEELIVYAMREAQLALAQHTSGVRGMPRKPSRCCWKRSIVRTS